MSTNRAEKPLRITLEGARMTKKTDVCLFLFQRSFLTNYRKYQYHMPIIFGEWRCETSGTSLINYDHANETRANKLFKCYVDMMKLSFRKDFLIDRFYISNCVFNNKKRSKIKDFMWLEEELLPMGFKNIFLWRDSSTFEEALEERKMISRNPSNYNDFSLQKFIDQQNIFFENINQSILPFHKIDISGKTTENISNETVKYCT